MPNDIPLPAPPPGPPDRTFFTAKPRTSSSWRDLPSMLEDIHNEHRATIAEANIASPGKFKDPGEYKQDAACVGVKVKLRALSRADVADYHADLAQAEQEASKDKTGTALLHAQVAARARLHPAIVMRLVSGIHAEVEAGTIKWETKDPSDTMPPHIALMLDEAGFMFILYTVADHFQGLGPLARRGFGSPRPSTSPPSTAAHAHSGFAEHEAAPATRTPLSFEESHSPLERALSNGSVALGGLGGHSSSTGSPTASPEPPRST